ncbi:trypsin-like serine peptidase [Crossiella cryophila]|uniref:V8-like Glu-specific endopeptidase n=1 Tax=Crossiella cryophila TaxID=43355 RepID=A0A7W7CJ03_9PSEU|nr:trypsin-like serine protease [Crossiella cryophila]MBB4682152.1 V8-like Glu-specific endopeptidase [Crossiella cryophila]
MRIARIVPVLALVVGAALSGATAQAAPAAPERLASPVAPAVAAGPGTKDAWYSTTNGKLTYVNGNGENSECSASSVNSPSGRVVVTAGHCVYRASTGGVSTNFTYHPGYHMGVRLPAFTVAYAEAAPQWLQGDYRHDYAFLVTNDLPDGRRLVDVAGAHGLIINSAYRQQVHVAGYPYRMENGEAQWYCWGTAGREAGTNRHTMGCDGNDGASGGPWLRNYKPNGLGDVISVTSTNPNKINHAPYFGPEAKALYLSVANR